MKDPSNKFFWQQIARLYAPFMKSSEPLYDEIARRCLPYLTPATNALELACGSGQLTFRLAAHVQRWEATDFSENMITAAKRRPAVPNLSFSVQDATALSYADASFDVVLIANALHIMPEPDRALAEIYRVLKTGGILMAPTFIWGTDARQRLSEGLMKLVGFRVLQRWDADTFAVYTALRGFTVLEKPVIGGSIRPLCCLIAQKS